jgi:hypothetical protein
LVAWEDVRCSVPVYLRAKEETEVAPVGWEVLPVYQEAVVTVAAAAVVARLPKTSAAMVVTVVLVVVAAVVEPRLAAVMVALGD